LFNFLVPGTFNRGRIIFFSAIQEGVVFYFRREMLPRAPMKELGVSQMESRFIVFYFDRMYFDALITVR